MPTPTMKVFRGAILKGRNGGGGAGVEGDGEGRV